MTSSRRLPRLSIQTTSTCCINNKNKSLLPLDINSHISFGSTCDELRLPVVLLILKSGKKYTCKICSLSNFSTGTQRDSYCSSGKNLKVGELLTLLLEKGWIQTITVQFSMKSMMSTQDTSEDILDLMFEVLLLCPVQVANFKLVEAYKYGVSAGDWKYKTFAAITTLDTHLYLCDHHIFVPFLHPLAPADRVQSMICFL